MILRRLVVGALLVALLTGGTSTKELLKAQTAPSAALRKTLTNAARNYLYDPYSVRDAEISSVVTFDRRRGLQSVCVKANAKNLYGAYVGRRAVLVRLQRGVPLGRIDGASWCFTRGLRYFRFRELEAL